MSYYLDPVSWRRLHQRHFSGRDKPSLQASLKWNLFSIHPRSHGSTTTEIFERRPFNDDAFKIFWESNNLYRKEEPVTKNVKVYLSFYLHNRFHLIEQSLKYLLKDLLLSMLLWSICFKRTVSRYLNFLKEQNRCLKVLSSEMDLVKIRLIR